jgi:hypothetical protein
MQIINKKQYTKNKKQYVEKQYLPGTFPIYIKEESWEGIFIIHVLNKHGVVKVEKIKIYPPEQENTLWQIPASGWMGTISRVIMNRRITTPQLHELRNNIISKMQYQKEIIMAKYGIEEYD